MSKQENKGKEQANPMKIDKETLLQLDDGQLKQIAGGAIDGNPGDYEEEETCSYVGTCHPCGDCSGPQTELQ